MDAEKDQAKAPGEMSLNSEWFESLLPRFFFARIAVQKARIVHFEQDFLSCCLLRAHRVSAVQGALVFRLRLRCSKSLWFLGAPLH